MLFRSAYTNAVAGRRTAWLWPTNTGGGYYGSNILSGGIYVGLNPVPTNDATWATAPFEAQYLKIYDVTPPPALASAPVTGLTNTYLFGTNVTFSWPSVTDAEGGISGYHLMVGTTPGGSNVFSGTVTGTNYTVSGSYGAHLYATVTAINNAGIESTPSTSSAGIALLNLGWTPTPAMNGNNFLNWASVSGQVYQVWSTTNLLLPFAPLGNTITAAVPSLVFTNNPTNSTRYFKVQWLPQ